VLCEWIERPGSMRERRLLQLSVGVAGIVPVAAGVAGILLGPELVDAVVGAPARTATFAIFPDFCLVLALAFGALFRVPKLTVRDLGCFHSLSSPEAWRG
jgi:hypothetical protein